MKVKLLTIALVASAAFSQVAKVESKPKADTPPRTDLTPTQTLEMAQAGLKMAALENRFRELAKQATDVQTQMQAAGTEYEAAMKKYATEHHADGCSLDIVQKWTCPEKK